MHFRGPRREEREKGPEKILDEIIAEKFLNMGKKIFNQVQKVQSPRQAKPKEEHIVVAAAKSLQNVWLCVTPPGSPIPGILQARTLEWIAISFSNAWKCKVKVKSLSRVQLLATPWTAAYQAPLSMEFSRQEYWSGHTELDRTEET